MSTLHCALENGADLYVNERQKKRHYHARSSEERRRMPNLDFFTSRGAYVNCSIIALFLMYCVYGASRSSLLIESTDSMEHLVHPYL